MFIVKPYKLFSRDAVLIQKPNKLTGSMWTYFVTFDFNMWVCSFGILVFSASITARAHSVLARTERKIVLSPGLKQIGKLDDNWCFQTCFFNVFFLLFQQGEGL